ncbi:MAG: UDP-N-acetylmuramoyl-tripeptide--D-alanyl-D-alanine ligase [Reyranellaceae bacterium]
MIWTTESIYKALGAVAPDGAPSFTVDAVRLEPEECAPGSLFVPCAYNLQRTGRWPNEAAAIMAAVRRGATAAFTNLPRTRFPVAIPIMRLAVAPGSATEPTVGALVAMGRHARSTYAGTVVAITGSVGKTTTKDLVHHVLAGQRPAFKTVDNRNSIAGICQTLANLPLDSDYCVIEIGATEQGHMSHAHVARPQIAIVTSIGLSHLENYRSPDDIAREKLSLFDCLDGERIGFLHSSIIEKDEAWHTLARSKRVSRLITVGFRPHDDIHAVDLRFDGIASEGTISVFGRPYRFRLPLPGRHFVGSAMFAAGVACVAGLNMDAALGALADATPSAQRSERFRLVVPGGALELIDDSYNAAPDSVAALLDSLAERKAGRKILVLGDMLELGTEAEHAHAALRQKVGGAGVDLLLTVGKYAALASGDMAIGAHWHFADAETASAAIAGLLRPSDLVAVKGSHGIGLMKVVTAIRQIGVGSPAGPWRIEHETSG